MKDGVLVEATVEEVYSGDKYALILANGHKCIGYRTGKMRKRRIKVLQGDKVNVRLCTADLTRGIIEFRL